MFPQLQVGVSDSSVETRKCTRRPWDLLGEDEALLLLELKLLLLMTTLEELLEKASVLGAVWGKGMDALLSPVNGSFCFLFPLSSFVSVDIRKGV